MMILPAGEIKSEAGNVSGKKFKTHKFSRLKDAKLQILIPSRGASYNILSTIKSFNT